MFPSSCQVFDGVVRRDGNRRFARVRYDHKGTTTHRQPLKTVEYERRPSFLKPDRMRLLFRTAELSDVEQRPGLSLRVGSAFDDRLPERPGVDVVLDALSVHGVAHGANLAGSGIPCAFIDCWYSRVAIAKVIRDFVVQRNNCVKNAHCWLTLKITCAAAGDVLEFGNEYKLPRQVERLVRPDSLYMGSTSRLTANCSQKTRRR